MSATIELNEDSLIPTSDRRGHVRQDIRKTVVLGAGTQDVALARGHLAGAPCTTQPLSLHKNCNAMIRYGPAQDDLISGRCFAAGDINILRNQPDAYC